MFHLPETQYESNFFVTDGVNIIEPDSWLIILEWELWSVSMYLYVSIYVCCRCVVSAELICKRALLIWLKKLSTYI